MMIYTLLKQTLETLAEALFPLDAEERKVLSLSAGTLLKKAPVEHRDLPPLVYAPLAYRHPLTRALIHLLKFKNNRRAAKLTAEILSQELPYLLAEELILKADKILLVPVPIGRSRLRERGYSQTLRLAQELLNLQTETKLVLAEVLTKAKETPAQTSLPERARRLQNVHGSFALSDANLVCGALVIVLDDVITTGATLAEARRVLENAGARKVFCLAVAH